MSVFFAQTNPSDRLRGMNERFGRDTAVDDGLVLVLGLLAVAALGWWAWSAKGKKARFFAVFGDGPEGLGLDRTRLADWYACAPPSVRANPARVRSQPALMSAELARLGGERRDGLADAVHDAWVASEPLLRRPSTDLRAGERVLLRDSAGRLVAEGLVTSSDGEELAFAPMTLGDLGRTVSAGHLVRLERRSRPSTRARVLSLDGDRGRWRLLFGDAALREHRREHYRVDVDLAAHVLGDHPVVAHLRQESSGVWFDGPKAAPGLIERLERSGHLVQGVRGRVEDLSNEGIRLRTDATFLRVGDDAHVLLRLSIESKIVEMLLHPRVIGIESGSNGNRVRGQFIDSTSEEAAILRRLVHLFALGDDAHVKDLLADERRAHLLR